MTDDECAHLWITGPDAVQCSRCGDTKQLPDTVALRAADILDAYADWITRNVSSAQIEEHPYLPEIQDTAERLRAAADEITRLRAQGERLTESLAQEEIEHARTTRKANEASRIIGDECERQRDRAEQAEADAQRFAWVLPIVTGTDTPDIDRRTMAIAAALLQGLDGRAAIDQAIAILAADAARGAK